MAFIITTTNTLPAFEFPSLRVFWKLQRPWISSRLVKNTVANKVLIRRESWHFMCKMGPLELLAMYVSMGLVKKAALNDCNLVLSKERKIPKSDH